MITGMHAIVYSKHAAAVRSFLADVLEWRSVDAGEPGREWPIFAAPPAELAVHPTDDDPSHEFYLMCDDVDALVSRLAQRGIAATPVVDQGWGRVTAVELPGGETIGIYQPQHPSPLSSS